MRELITIQSQQINGQSVNTVNGRDLHGFLGVKDDFSTWVKYQIKRGRFVESRDFMSFQENSGKPQGGRPTTEYAFTLDAGKHIAMMSGTDKGFEVRDYFIECERIAKQPADPMTYLNDPAAMRTLLLTYTEKVLALEEEKKILTPKAQALDRISTSDGMTCITDTAKTLQIRPKDLFDWLSANQWIYRRVGGKGWVAYQNRLQQGVLSHKITAVQTTDGRDKVIESVKVTPKGLAKLANIFSRRCAA